MTRFRFLACLLLALVAGPALAAVTFTPYEKASFETLVKSGKPVVVHVHATW